MPFKALLLNDNGRPRCLHHESAQVVFLPRSTTSSLQPLDEGIIATLKALYIKRTLSCILEKMEDNESLKVTEAWKNFTISDCVKHVGVS